MVDSFIEVDHCLVRAYAPSWYSHAIKVTLIALVLYVTVHILGNAYARQQVAI